MKTLILIATLAIAGLTGWGVGVALDQPFIVELLIAMGLGYLIGTLGGFIASEYAD